MPLTRRKQEFQDGHLANGMILTILNLDVAPMLPVKFQLNPNYSLGGDVIWRISRWPPLDIEMEQF